MPISPPVERRTKRLQRRVGPQRSRARPHTSSSASVVREERRQDSPGIGRMDGPTNMADDALIVRNRLAIPALLRRIISLPPADRSQELHRPQCVTPCATSPGRGKTMCTRTTCAAELMSGASGASSASGFQTVRQQAGWSGRWREEVTERSHVPAWRLAPAADRRSRVRRGGVRWPVGSGTPRLRRRTYSPTEQPSRREFSGGARGLFPRGYEPLKFRQRPADTSGARHDSLPHSVAPQRAGLKDEGRC